MPHIVTIHQPQIVSFVGDGKTIDFLSVVIASRSPIDINLFHRLQPLIRKVTLHRGRFHPRIGDLHSDHHLLTLFFDAVGVDPLQLSIALTDCTSNTHRTVEHVTIPIKPNLGGLFTVQKYDTMKWFLCAKIIGNPGDLERLKRIYDHQVEIYVDPDKPYELVVILDEIKSNEVQVDPIHRQLLDDMMSHMEN